MSILIVIVLLCIVAFLWKFEEETKQIKKDNELIRKYIEENKKRSI